MKAIFIHSTGGDSDECWYPWLKNELINIGYEVFIPTFPSPEGQTLDNWMKVFNPLFKEIDENTIIIGRSIGPPFILRILEKLNVKIKATFLVAGFCSDLQNPMFAPVVDSFIEGGFDWDKIKSNCNKFFVYHGFDDPVVPIKYANELSEKLGVKLNITLDGGHFNIGTPYGYRFYKILEDIKKV